MDFFGPKTVLFIPPKNRPIKKVPQQYKVDFFGPTAVLFIKIYPPKNRPIKKVPQQYKVDFFGPTAVPFVKIVPQQYRTAEGSTSGNSAIQSIPRSVLV